MKYAKSWALFLALLALAALPALADTGSFDRTLQVSGAVDLDVTTGSGNIAVRAGGAGTVHVVAKIRAHDSWSGISASEKIRRLEANPPIEQQGNTIRIGYIEDRDLRNNISIDYDLTVPAQTKLGSHTGSGNQSVKGLQLSVTANTGSGNVTVEDVGADLNASTGSGEIKITSLKGDLKAQTGSGNVEMRGIKGGLRIHTGSGDVTAEGEPTGDWRIGTGSGSIEVKVPSKLDFSLDARTSSGEMTIHHPLTVEGTVSRNHLQGKVGNGGVLLDLHTGSGNIEVN
ncbi:MAG TPA: DUF4097 family beta strand repeat-containing protein [Candidatus Acidoferrales bacterium]|nr:DUF4097 family beta strand repeat-containing protein [Candidatus Acidoferrales bacterium]